MIDTCLIQVQFEVSDATKREFEKESFDVVYSRDTILHIKDKKAFIFVVLGKVTYQYTILIMHIPICILIY